MKTDIKPIDIFTDQKAPYRNSAKYGKIESKRDAMLSEAHSIIFSMTDKQFDAFLDMIRNELGYEVAPE